MDDGSLTIKLDQASIGGDLVGAVDLAIAAKDGVVTVERLDAELPGENRIEASGRLTRGAGGPVFVGPIKLEGSKLRSLAQSQYRRAQELSAQGFISKQARVEAASHLKVQQAAVALASAQLGKTVISAPFDGLVTN